MPATHPGINNEIWANQNRPEEEVNGSVMEEVEVCHWCASCFRCTSCSLAFLLFSASLESCAPPRLPHHPPHYSWWSGPTVQVETWQRAGECSTRFLHATTMTGSLHRPATWDCPGEALGGPSSRLALLKRDAAAVTFREIRLYKQTHQHHAMQVPEVYPLTEKEDQRWLRKKKKNSSTSVQLAWDVMGGNAWCRGGHCRKVQKWHLYWHGCKELKKGAH